MSRKMQRLNRLRQSLRSERERPQGSMPRREQARLVTAARGGDALAMRRLLTAISGPVYRFGRGFCRDPHDAEDVMQEVLAALSRGLTRFRGEASLTSWAYVVARRACLRHRRRRAAEPARMTSLDAGPVNAADATALVDRDADPHRRLERRELAALLEQAIAALPAPQREVLLLRDVEGLSAREVGTTLHLGVRAVKSRLHRARLTLRGALAPHLGIQRSAAPPVGAAVPAATCGDAALLVSRFLEGELTAARCAQLSVHVERCADCTAACESLRAALGACRAWGSGPVPSEVRERVRTAIRRAAGADGSVAPRGTRA